MKWLLEVNGSWGQKNINNFKDTFVKGYSSRREYDVVKKELTDDLSGKLFYICSQSAFYEEK